MYSHEYDRSYQRYSMQERDGKRTTSSGKYLQTVQKGGYKNILGCACTTSKTELRTELEMYQHETNKDKRKMKKLYTLRNMPGKRLSAIVNSASWVKETIERTGSR